MGDRLSIGNTNITRVDTSKTPGRGMGTYQRRPGSQPVYAPYQLTEEFTDHRRPALQAKLYEESVGFRNLASDPEIQERAKAAVLGSLKDVYNVMEFLRNKWLILYRLYRGETLAQYQYGRNSLHSPEPFKIVETMHPRIMRTLFGSDRWFRLYGEKEEYDSAARSQELLLRHQFREMEYARKASNMVRSGLIYGTAIQKCYWKQKIREVRYRDGKRIPNPDFPGTTQIELSEVNREELVFDGNTVENVEIFDFYTAPNATDIDKAEWCADRRAWSDYEVKEMGELGHWLNLEGLKDHQGTSDPAFGDEFKERKSYAYGVFDPREASWAPHVPHYTVIDWWGPLVIKQRDDSYVTKMCNVVLIEPDSKNIIARVTENPFWHHQKPYQVWRPVSIENEFYGIGSLEMIARMSMEKDIKRNLLLTATQLEANPMLLVQDDANIPDGQLLAEPGLVLRVPSVTESIAPLHVPQVSDSALKAENVLTQDIRETAGTTSPVMGASDPMASDKTATQFSGEVDQASSRLAGPVEAFEREVLVPMLNQMAWNNQQFITYDKVVREIGPQGIRFQDRYTVGPEDLLGKFIVQPLASHKLTQKVGQVQQLVNILDRAPIINQMYGPNAVKMPKLLAKILEWGFDFQDVDEFLTLPPEEASLLTALEEHELWYHGEVPNRKPDDNDVRHLLAHQEEIATERFERLERMSPAVGHKVRAHIAEHMRKMALMQEIQEKMLMEMAQMQSMQGMGSAPAGAAEPGQGPNSPKVRGNEQERQEGRGGGPKDEGQAEATRRSPNRGAA